MKQHDINFGTEEENKKIDDLLNEAAGLIIDVANRKLDSAEKDDAKFLHEVKECQATMLAIATQFAREMISCLAAAYKEEHRGKFMEVAIEGLKLELTRLLNPKRK